MTSEMCCFLAACLAWALVCLATLELGSENLQQDPFINLKAARIAFFFCESNHDLSIAIETT
jgi:hypothetical protein